MFMRTPKPGCTCKVYGEGEERFKVRAVENGRVIFENTDSEPIEKCYSIRYAPRLKSYYADHLNSEAS